MFWAIIYLRRRSIVAPVVSHSGFNLLQLGQFLYRDGNTVVIEKFGIFGNSDVHQFLIPRFRITDY